MTLRTLNYGIMVYSLLWVMQDFAHQPYRPYLCDKREFPNYNLTCYEPWFPLLPKYSRLPWHRREFSAQTAISVDSTATPSFSSACASTTADRSGGFELDRIPEGCSRGFYKHVYKDSKVGASFSKGFGVLSTVESRSVVRNPRQ